MCLREIFLSSVFGESTNLQLDILVALISIFMGYKPLFTSSQFMHACLTCDQSQWWAQLQLE